MLNRLKNWKWERVCYLHQAYNTALGLCFNHQYRQKLKKKISTPKNFEAPSREIPAAAGLRVGKIGTLTLEYCNVYGRWGIYAAPTV